MSQFCVHKSVQMASAYIARNLIQEAEGRSSYKFLSFHSML